MVTKITVYISDNEFEYSSESAAGDGDDLQEYVIIPDGIVIKLKDGSVDQFQNCSYAIFKKKEEGDLDL